MKNDRTLEEKWEQKSREQGKHDGSDRISCFHNCNRQGLFWGDKLTADSRMDA